MKDKIKQLISSEDETNIELAVNLIKSQYPNAYNQLSSFYERFYAYWLGLKNDIDGLVSLFKQKGVSILNKIKVENLKDYEEGFSFLTNLTELHLIGSDPNLDIKSGGRLKEIPEFVYELHNLKTLNLHENELKEVSPKIKNLKGLVVLTLNDCSFEEFPEEILELENLNYEH